MEEFVLPEWNEALKQSSNFNCSPAKHVAGAAQVGSPAVAPARLLRAATDRRLAAMPRVEVPACGPAMPCRPRTAGQG